MFGIIIPSKLAPLAIHGAVGMLKLQPATLEQLRSTLASEHDSLSRRLKEVSSYVSDNPQSIAIDTAAVIADKAGVHASTLVRFANHFGFNGFTELQQLFKDYIHENYTDYGARIRQLQQSLGEQGDVSPNQLLNEFTESNLLSLQYLRDSIDLDALNSAVNLLDTATTIHVCGIRRAFPVAMSIVYALNHMHVNCHAIDGLGLMHSEQASCISANDVLIAITFSPYADVTQAMIKTAKANSADVILITDDSDCPGIDYANVVLTVQDAEVRSFRSLSSSMCLAQTLCVALGYRREINTTEQPVLNEQPVLKPRMVVK